MRASTMMVCAAVALGACGDDRDAADAGDGDVAGEIDGSIPFEVAMDTPQTEVETEVAVEVEVADETEVAVEVDGSGPVLPLPGFGVISGDCGVLDDELTAAEPSLFVNHIDFGTDPYDEGDLALLTDGGREIIKDGNAGGSSILSEVFAYEMLARCEGAVLLKTETEIVYDTPAKITDMVVEIDGLKIGANPTRAIGFPFDAPYTVEQATTILEKKLGDIKSSTETVSAVDRWVKQILTVFAYAEGHVASVETAWAAIDPALRADTIVIVTVTDGADTFIYSND